MNEEIISFEFRLIKNNPALYRVTFDKKKWFLFEEKDQDFNLHSYVFNKVTKKNEFNKESQRRTVTLAIKKHQVILCLYLTNDYKFQFRGTLLKEQDHEQAEDGQGEEEQVEEEFEQTEEEQLVFKKQKVEKSFDALFKLSVFKKFNFFEDVPETYLQQLENYAEENKMNLFFIIENFDKVINGFVLDWFVLFEKQNEQKLQEKNINWNSFRIEFINFNVELKHEIIMFCGQKPSSFFKFIQKKRLFKVEEKKKESFLKTYFETKIVLLKKLFNMSEKSSLIMSLANINNINLFKTLSRKISKNSLDTFWSYVRLIDEDLKNLKDDFNLLNEDESLSPLLIMAEQRIKLLEQKIAKQRNN